MQTIWKAALRALSVGNFEKATHLMLDCWEACPPNELMTVQVDKEDVMTLADMLDSATSFHYLKSDKKLTPEQEQNLRSWFKMFLDGGNQNPCE